MSGDARDINDAAFTLALHHRSKNLTGQKCAADQIQIKVLTPLGRFDCLERMTCRDCDPRIVGGGGVDENRRDTEVIGDRIARCCQRRWIEGVSEKELSNTRSLLNRAHAGLASV